MNEPIPFAGTPEERKEKASGPILGALEKARKEFDSWQATCDTIDAIYSRGFLEDGLALEGADWGDAKLDLFWASFEVLKPAVYARAPIPAVKPMFSDGGKVQNLTAEVLERATTSAFARTNINDVMLGIRDDLLFAGRGVPWMRYETDGCQKVCADHLDRTDFLHEPARKWSEVGWVAGRFWLTREEVKARFTDLTEEQLDSLNFTQRRDKDETEHAVTPKVGVWEVWHKADKKTYWVTEGLDVLLDEREPQLTLSGFFPCPRPAYATLKRRSLVPVPDWNRYAVHFRKISDLTARIYTLLDQVRMMGLIGGGGDIADALEDMMKSDDDQIVVRVNTMGAVAEQIAWLPLVDIATTIQGLIEARGQLIDDFYQLSGISDIMRGATEAQETLGAQQLKSQYGSVRVRDKIDELQRVAADSVKIAAEIIAEHFTRENLLDMAQMEIPTKAELEKRVKEIEDAAEKELEALGKQAEEAAEQAQQAGQQVDPAQARQMLQQAQQPIVAKYAGMLAEAEAMVPIEDVIKLLRDDKARSFAFEVESDSTILTDELQEKQSRKEFMGEFTSATQGLMGLMSMGEPGAQLAGEMLKFVLAPYRAGRQLDSAIDAFIEAAPEMARMAAGQEGEGDALAEANNKLAEAEMQKARAAMASVEAKAALDKAEMQRKMMEMQQKAGESERKFAAEAEKLRQSASANAVKAEEAIAKVDLLRAQTMKALAEAGVAVDNQALDEFKSLNDIEFRERDQVMKAAQTATDQQFRERGEQRADRQQDAAERQSIEQQEQAK